MKDCLEEKSRSPEGHLSPSSQQEEQQKAGQEERMTTLIQVNVLTTAIIGVSGTLSLLIILINKVP